MLGSAVGKVMWLGRATVFLVGLVVILAVVFGVASAALGANGGNFILGQLNKATAITQLNGNVSGGPALRVNNTNTAAGSRALQLGVAEGRAPLTVNATAGKATNLNADKLDGLDSTQLTQGRVSISGTSHSTFGAIVEHFEGFGNYGVGFRKIVSHPEKGNPIDISIRCTNQSTAGTLRIENKGEFGDSQFVWVDDGSTNPTVDIYQSNTVRDLTVPTGGEHLTIRITNVFSPRRMATIELFTGHGNTGCDANAHAIYTFAP